MNLTNLKPKTKRKNQKRVGRGGKRGFSSGHGTKGQKGRAGASVKPGFRGGDNRIWQLFPKLRGASKKPGNSKPHRKHRYFMLKHGKGAVVNLRDLNVFKDGQEISPEVLLEAGLVQRIKPKVKVLGSGDLKKKLNFVNLELSKSAKVKIEKVGGTIR